MRYPVAIEPGDPKHAWGVTVPDLPGCFSAGETIEEALDNAHDAILFHIEGLIDDGEAIPEAASIDKYRRKREFRGRVWAFVEVDLSQLEDTTERVNITLPRRVLHKLDAAARAAGETRSGYIAHLALTGR